VEVRLVLHNVGAVRRLLLERVEVGEADLILGGLRCELVSVHKGIHNHLPNPRDGLVPLDFGVGEALVAGTGHRLEVDEHAHDEQGVCS
tara:strand:+ start:6422 stop:6688 length:267 start_codon:yes stop_codon:yes gene_type:complete